MDKALNEHPKDYFVPLLNLLQALVDAFGDEAVLNLVKEVGQDVFLVACPLNTFSFPLQFLAMRLVGKKARFRNLHLYPQLNATYLHRLIEGHHDDYTSRPHKAGILLYHDL